VAREYLRIDSHRLHFIFMETEVKLIKSTNSDVWVACHSAVRTNREMKYSDEREMVCAGVARSVAAPPPTLVDRAYSMMFGSNGAAISLSFSAPAHALHGECSHKHTREIVATPV
jgi:hypothetical protein